MFATECSLALWSKVSKLFQIKAFSFPVSSIIHLHRCVVVYEYSMICLCFIIPCFVLALHHLPLKMEINGNDHVHVQIICFYLLLCLLEI